MRLRLEIKSWIYLTIICLTLSACNLRATDTSESDLDMPSTDSPQPTPTQIIPPTPTQQVLPAAAIDPETVALDFVEQMCLAEWSNSGEYINCPSNPETIEKGYVARVDNPTTYEGLIVEQPALLTIPAREGIYAGIFGAYPPFTVQQGDKFRTILACYQSTSPCNVDYALEYYDSSGNYHTYPTGLGPNRIETHNESSGGFSYINLSLDYLAGQTVQFLLVGRDQVLDYGGEALWIAPHIFRDPNYVPPPTTIPSEAVNTETEDTNDTTDNEDKIPGVIAGLVDMRTAPPYLNDPITTGGIGVPVVVVFFNLDYNTWWWIHTTLTHPNFQMTVTPGRYQIVAYATGVAGEPYTVGAYTGIDPSCGQPLKIVKVPPNGFINNIVLNDWDGIGCSPGERPAKPDEIPMAPIP